MYPGPEDPDFGAFVKQLDDELLRQGHEIARAVVDRRTRSVGKQLRLAAGALAAARRFRPEVVYAHYLFPAGGAAALASIAAGAPLVLTAHGRDVRNIGAVRGVASLTRLAARRAAVVIAVSDYLRRDLEARLPELSTPVEVIPSGVDLERFRGRDARSARREVGWEGDGPFFLCVGTLDQRKNVVRLARAFERLGAGSLAFVGDGPARASLAGKARVRVVGRVPHPEVARWLGAADVVCQPSLLEPLGQVLLEAMASERSVVASRIGGGPELVPPEAGVLVDPGSIDSIAAGMRHAAELPRPNAAARRAATRYDVRAQARRVAAVLERAVQGRRAQ
jgi:glycosyltransferase involved in cell wall biosynthesis